MIALCLVRSALITSTYRIPMMMLKDGYHHDTIEETTKLGHILCRKLPEVTQLVSSRTSTQTQTQARACALSNEAYYVLYMCVHECLSPETVSILKV